MAANRRKVLVPLATLMVAGAVAVGSGASFTSTTASTTTVTSGAVTHVNDVTTLAITNIKDKDTITGTVKITNTGSLPSDLTVAQISAPTQVKPFITGDLRLKITVPGLATPVYDGTFGQMSTTPVALGSLAADPDGPGGQPGGSITATFVVTLNETTNNTNENAQAVANFQWVSTQQAGSSNPFSSAFDALTGSGN